jgi:VIT1/CCC1 family predicted Fe2+/Mn2+ transporter
MADPLVQSSKRVLDPFDRVSAVLFGLIIVVAFTGSLSVAGAGHDSIRTLLIGAVGCGLAWGVIDGVMHLMGRLAAKEAGLVALRAVHAATDPLKAQRLIAAALPAPIASVIQPAELELIRLRLKQLPEPPGRARLAYSDCLGAAMACLLVSLSMLPVVGPFVFMEDGLAALRVSHGIAIGMLFLTGCAFGRITGRNPAAVGAAMAIVGAVLVGLTIALGG